MTCKPDLWPVKNICHNIAVSWNIVVELILLIRHYLKIVEADVGHIRNHNATFKTPNLQEATSWRLLT